MSVQKDNDRVRFFYNRIAPFYSLIDFFLKSQKKLLVQKINALPYGKLLDIGVGNGKHIPLIHKHQYTGIDISEKMLSKAMKLAPNTELTLMSAEALHYPTHSYDYIIISHVLSISNYPELIIKEAQRVLKPSGKLFILNHHTPDNFLKYIDQFFNRISPWFCFHSHFKIDEIAGLDTMQLLEKNRLDPLDYTQLFIYQK